MSNICLKASKKLSALTTVAKFPSFEKIRILFKGFIELQFKYCSLVWMFHGRQTNDKTNRVLEKGLRIVYNDSFTLIEELLVKDKTFTILYITKILNHWQSKCTKL